VEEEKGVKGLSLTMLMSGARVKRREKKDLQWFLRIYNTTRRV